MRPVISETFSGPPSSSISWSRVLAGSSDPSRSILRNTSAFNAQARSTLDWDTAAEEEGPDDDDGGTGCAIEAEEEGEPLLNLGSSFLTRWANGFGASGFFLSFFFCFFLGLALPFFLLFLLAQGSSSSLPAPKGLNSSSSSSTSTKSSSSVSSSSSSSSSSVS